MEVTHQIKEKEYFKRMLKYAGGTFAAGLLLFAGFIWVADPFYHYHEPWFGMPVVLETAVYQTAGAAENLPYDSAIVGTSMTENMHTSWFDEEMGWTTMKLSYSGARSNDLQAIFSQMDKNEGELKHVVMDINDYQYLFNHDVFVAALERCMDGLKGVEDNIDTAYSWEDDVLFGEDIALQVSWSDRIHLLWERAGEVGEAGLYKPDGKVSDDIDARLQFCQENLDNIIPFIQAYPETEFHIIFPPYSVLYWEQKVLDDELENILATYAYAINAFLEYENVKLYYFHYEPEIISNLDNYRDSTHHTPEYNRYVFECIRDGKNRLTVDNYKEKLTQMYEYAKEFPYLTLWEGY